MQGSFGKIEISYGEFDGEFNTGKIYEKPLNPVLGETYEAVAVDGGKILME